MLKLLKRLWYWCFPTQKEITVNHSEHNPDDFDIPEVPKNYVASLEVIQFSYFLKQLGVNQNLEYGDWYCIQENGEYLAKIFYKNDVNNFEDFEFLTKKNFVRLIGQDEAVNLLKIAGYEYPKTDAYKINPKNGYTTMKVHNKREGNAITVTAVSPHGCSVKAAYLVLATRKLTVEYSNKLLSFGFPGSKPNES